MTDVLYWMYEGTTVDKITKDFPWICADRDLPEPPCKNPKSCQVVLDSDSIGLEGLGGTR